MPIPSDAFIDDAISDDDALAASIRYRLTEVDGVLTLQRASPDDPSEGLLEDHEVSALVLECLDAGHALRLLKQ